MRVEARAADQHSIDLLLDHKALDIVWFHAAAVENAHIVGAKFFLNLAAEEAMRNPLSALRSPRFTSRSARTAMNQYE